jgi:diguanylate cyclase (GGDEF)-like protein/PAS domain S-box-containing protein
VASQALPGYVAPAYVIDALGIAAVIAVIAGVRRNRPRDPAAWCLIAAGVAWLVAGDVVWDTLSFWSATEAWSETVANVCYLAAYPILALGLLRFVRARTQRRDTDALADALIVAVAAVVPAWQFLMSPALDAAPLTLDTVAAILYPVLDLILIGALARLLFVRTRPSIALGLLLGGLGLTLFADIFYLHLLSTDWYPDWLDLLWPASYVLLAAAALHPSMRTLTEPAPPRPVGLEVTRTALLASALALGPVISIAERIRGHAGVNPYVIGPVTVLLAVLVTWRLVHAAREADRAMQEVRHREERLRSLLEHATDVIMVIGGDARVRYVSPAIEELLGSPPELYLGNVMDNHIHSDDRDSAAAALARTLARPGQAATIVVRLRHRDGAWRWVEVLATNRLHEPGVQGVVCNARDVTARKHLEELQAAETRALDMIARGAPLISTLTHVVQTVEEQLPDGRCSIRLLHGPTAVMKGAVAPSLPPEYMRQLDAMVPMAHDAERVATVLTDGEPETIDLLAGDRRPASRDLAAAFGLRWCWVVPILASEDGRVLGAFGVYVEHPDKPRAVDVALVERAAALAAVAIDRAEAEERLEHQTLHDPMTQLPNRVLMVDRLTHALLRLERNPRGLVGVLFLDVDRFKVINDSLGHDAGDELLVALGGRLSDTLQPDDTVARFGGDEFVVLCEQIEERQEVVVLAERIAAALQQPFRLERGEVVVTVSIGVAVSRRAADPPERLLRDADVAMYRAKERGGARHELFDEAMHTRAVARLQTERALRYALEHDELGVLFQPQVELDTGACISVEALARWEHAVRGTVMPADFIPVAEETGLIIPLGDRVLSLACAHAARWQHIGRDDGPLGVSVNLSAHQLVRPDLCPQVARLLGEHSLAPETICLEITESVLLDDVDATVAALAALKDLGVRLAIDDFGTGYSSLSYLKQFPFDELKIDAAFVAGLGHPSDDAIVAATIDMAHGLGMVAAAEGVETTTQLDRLRDLGCDLAQGFLLARPQPAEIVDEMAGGIVVAPLAHDRDGRHRGADRPVLGRHPQPDVSDETEPRPHVFD